MKYVAVYHKTSEDRENRGTFALSGLLPTWAHRLAWAWQVFRGRVDIILRDAPAPSEVPA